jgi:hypothetical protein
MASARLLNDLFRLRLRQALVLQPFEPRPFRHAPRALATSAAARAAHGAADRAVSLSLQMFARGMGVPRQSGGAFSHALVLAFKQRPESQKKPALSLSTRHLFPGLPLWAGPTASPFIGIPVVGVLKPKPPRTPPWLKQKIFVGATFGLG